MCGVRIKVLSRLRVTGTVEAHWHVRGITREKTVSAERLMRVGTKAD